MKNVRWIAAAVGALWILTAPAAAHHVWIEPGADGKLRLHFGEFAENLREVTGKLLNRIELTARKQTASGVATVTAVREADGFALGGAVSAGESLVAEDARYEITERKTGDRVVRSSYQPAARFLPDMAVRPAVLTLDVLPTVQPGKFKVEFRGKPLAKAKVNVIALSGWGRETQSEDDGTFEVTLPWKGLYALEVTYTERAPSQRGDVTLDAVMFVTTLSFIQNQGLESLPRPPAAKPNE